MLKLVKKIMFFCTIFMGVVSMSMSTYASEDYKQLNSKQDVDPFQNLSFTYNVELDKSTVNNDTIFVVDSEEFLVETNVTLGKNKKTVIIEAPEDGYEAGEEYFLYLTNEVRSVKDKKSTTSSIMSFTIVDKREELAEYEVNIIVEDIKMPKSWLKNPSNGYAVPLDKDQIERTIQVIEEAIDKYPHRVINDNLKNVYLVKEIGFYGVKYGGTNSTDSVYITSQKSYSDESIEQLFHAEFSSILLRNYKANMDSKEWNRLNPAGFSYLETGVEALKMKENGTFVKQDEKVLNNNGFLTEYAMSSAENDFNAFTKIMFLGDPKFWHKVDSYPRLNGKFELVIDFYSSVDATFTEDYFRSIMN